MGIEKAEKDQAAGLFAQLVVNGDLGEDDIDVLKKIVADRAGIGRLALDLKLKGAK